MATLNLGARAHQIELAFMDCDGIIFDVNAAKSQAFYAALEGYPEKARTALVDHHQAYGGVSRYDKFAHFFRHIHPLDDAAQAIEQALERYGIHSRAGYAPLSANRHALAFAAQVGNDAPVYVVSGSDQNELRDIFETKGVAQRFAGVCGSPTRKPEHMQRLLKQHRVSPKNAIMVGDGRADFEAAAALEVPFIFLSKMSEWRDAPEHLEQAVTQGRAFLFPSWPSLLQQLVP